MNHKAAREESAKSAEPVKPPLLPKAPAADPVEQNMKRVGILQNRSRKSIREYTWAVGDPLCSLGRIRLSLSDREKCLATETPSRNRPSAC